MGVSRETLDAAFDAALADLALKHDAITKLAEHWELLLQWNSHTNLTAIRSDEEAAWLHYRDSLEVLPHLPEGSVMDVGSGGGFPGIPIAVVEPHRRVLLIESRRKRASFLSVAIARLGLSNVTVLHARIEDVTQSADAVVTRATFSSNPEACLDRVNPGGVFVAFRSQPEGGADETHRYELFGHRRALLVWRK